MRRPNYLDRGLLLLCLIGAAASALSKEELLQLKSEDDVLVAPMNVAALNRLSLAALGGTPGEVGTFLPIFDRRLDSVYTARNAGPATINVLFHRSQTLHAIRLLLGEGTFEWSVATAESSDDLELGNGTFRYVLTAREGRSIGNWLEGKLATPASVKALRITIRPLQAAAKVVIKEANLIAEQRLEAISVKAKSNALPIGEQVPLEILAYYSGGELRAASGKGLKWTVRPDNIARMTANNRIVGRRIGPVEVSASLGNLVAPPLPFQVVEAD